MFELLLRFCLAIAGEVTLEIALHIYVRDLRVSTARDVSYM